MKIKEKQEVGKKIIETAKKKKNEVGITKYQQVCVLF